MIGLLGLRCQRQHWIGCHFACAGAAAGRLRMHDFVYVCMLSAGCVCVSVGLYTVVSIYIYILFCVREKKLLRAKARLLLAVCEGCR